MSQIKFKMENLKIKNPETSLNKMKRGNFFKLAGGAILGVITIANMPFKFFRQDSSVQSGSIKITENPNAVKRKPGVSKNG